MPILLGFDSILMNIGNCLEVKEIDKISSKLDFLNSLSYVSFNNMGKEDERRTTLRFEDFLKSPG